MSFPRFDRALAKRLGRILVRCALGLALSAVAVRAQVTLAHVGVSTPLLVYPAVALAALWGGPYAGVTAILTAALGQLYFVMAPASTFLIAVQRDALDLAIFSVVSSALVYAIVRTQRALDDARAAQASAEAATLAKETMIAIVAHDLRNPVQTIGLTAELLTIAASQDEHMKLRLDRLRRSAERMRRLVDSTIDSSRIGGEPFPLEKADCPLSALVDESVALFEPLAASRSIRLERPGAEALAGMIVCDKERIIQVLTHLLSNALEFTPRGGTVRLDVRRKPDGVRFEVADTGCGMTKDERAHAFERFWRGRRPGHGSGLGLWIAQALVEAHGAHIEAESTVGRGTTMAFVLPYRPAESTPLRTGCAGDRDGESTSPRSPPMPLAFAATPRRRIGRALWARRGVAAG